MEKVEHERARTMHTTRKKIRNTKRKDDMRQFRWKMTDGSKKKDGWTLSAYST